MPRNSSGTFSLPISGNPVVGGTSVSSTWANATLADLATEITSSLDRNGRGPMLAPLQVQNGAAATPSFTFQSETNSGIYRNAAGDIRMSIGGVDAMNWNASNTAVTALVTNALTLNGNATLGGSNPASTTAFANVITKKNVAKAWATIKTDGVGGVSVLDGFNIASVAINAGNASIRITFAQALSDASYSMAMFPGATALPVPVGLSGSTNKSTTVFDVGLHLYSAIGSLTATLNSAVFEFYVSFYGQQ